MWTLWWFVILIVAPRADAANTANRGLVNVSVVEYDTLSMKIHVKDQMTDAQSILNEKKKSRNEAITESLESRKIHGGRGGVKRGGVKRSGGPTRGPGFELLYPAFLAPLNKPP